MKNKKVKIFFLLIALLLGATVFVFKLKNSAPKQTTKEISPVVGSIQTTISTTGTVLPKNRLEVKPPVAGRVDSILVQEGDHVKSGQIVAWMSSTERAALLDAARGQGQ
jgi:membrane fusion protein, macrolide-specific efflux system